MFIDGRKTTCNIIMSDSPVADAPVDLSMGDNDGADDPFGQIGQDEDTLVALGDPVAVAQDESDSEDEEVLSYV